MSCSRPMRRGLKTHGTLSKAMSGFTYLGLVIALAVLSIGLLAVSDVWVSTMQRQRMAQLQWAGEQYAQAIGSYYHANTGSVRIYPMRLRDLVEDNRYFGIRRHLRRLYPNPFTHEVDWETIPAAEGGIRGVRASVETLQGRVTKTFVYVPGAP